MDGPETGGDAGAGPAGVGQNRGDRNGHHFARSGRPGCLSLAPRESGLSPDSSYSQKSGIGALPRSKPSPLDSFAGTACTSSIVLMAWQKHREPIHTSVRSAFAIAAATPSALLLASQRYP